MKYTIPILIAMMALSIAAPTLSQCKTEHLGNKQPYRFMTTGTSMQPLISEGDIVWNIKHPANQLLQGDIITYKDNGWHTTHRILSRLLNPLAFITKGDNNNQRDKKITLATEKPLKVFMVTRGTEVVFCA